MPSVSVDWPGAAWTRGAAADSATESAEVLRRTRRCVPSSPSPKTSINEAQLTARRILHLKWHWRGSIRARFAPCLQEPTNYCPEMIGQREGSAKRALSSPLFVGTLDGFLQKRRQEELNANHLNNHVQI